MWLREAVIAVSLIATLSSCSGNRSSNVLPVAGTNIAPLAAGNLKLPVGPRCSASNAFPAKFFVGFTIGGLSTSDAWVAALDQTAHLEFLHYSAGTVKTTVPSAPQFQSVSSILPISDTDVWFAGNAYSIGGYLLHFNGLAWSQVANAPGLDPTSTIVNSIAARSANDVWFAGETGVGKTTRLMLEHWNGTAMKLVAVGPYAVNGGAPDIIEFSPSNVFILVNGLIRNSIGVEVARWNGAHLMFTILPLLPGQASLASVGQQMAATSPTDVWVVSNAAPPGSLATTLQIWRFNGTWQPYLYTPVENTIVGQGMVALRANDYAITAINTTEPVFQALTFAYNGTTRWHLEPNNLPQFPIGKASHIAGTSSFWTLLGDPTGGSSEAVLVTCT